MTNIICVNEDGAILYSAQLYGEPVLHSPVGQVIKTEHLVDASNYYYDFVEAIPKIKPPKPLGYCEYIFNTKTTTWEPDCAATLVKLRQERQHLLATTDWTQLPGAPVDQQAWGVYRQQLRDFPSTCDLCNPIWPTPPT